MLFKTEATFSHGLPLREIDNSFRLDGGPYHTFGIFTVLGDEVREWVTGENYDRPSQVSSAGLVISYRYFSSSLSGNLALLSRSHLSSLSARRLASSGDFAARLFCSPRSLLRS